MNERVKQQMREHLSWQISIGVMIAAIVMAIVYHQWLPGLRISTLKMNVLLGFILYTSIVVRAVIWFSYNRQQRIRHNLQRLAGYMGMYTATFVISGLVMGTQGSDLLLLAVVVTLFGPIYGFNALRYLFRQGWDMFLFLMIVPVLLVVWVMNGMVASEGQTLNDLYNYLIITGIIYWVLIICALMLFSRYILKSSQEE